MKSTHLSQLRRVNVLGFLVVLCVGILEPSRAWVPHKEMSNPRYRSISLARQKPEKVASLLSFASAKKDQDDQEASTTSRCTATSGHHKRAVVTGVTLKIAFDDNWGVAEMANDVPSVRFTCDDSLDMVHRLRRDSDAVLVGRGTVKRDDCSLTVRRGVGPDFDAKKDQPLRVILDPRLSLILAELNEGVRYQVLDDGLPTVVYHCVPDVDMSSVNLLESVKLVYLPSAEDPPEGSRPGRYFSPQAVVENLKSNFQVQHLMIEGGPQTALNFLQENLVDRAIIVRAPIRFEEPYPSGITSQTLQDTGLELIGTRSNGIDTIDFWARPGQSWPTDSIEDWP